MTLLRALSDQLERTSGRTADIAVADLAPPLLLHEILREAEVLFCRDEDARAAFEERALREYLDTEHLRKTQREALRERVEERRAAQS